jgi:long-chain fatty acid transport protein
MTFKAAGTSANGGFGGQDLDAVLYQNWKDQTVVMAGAAYTVSDNLTLRFGGSVANNPVPAFYLNELFPATVEKHLTAGFGWKLTARTSVDFSYTHGFEVSQTNGGGVTVSHGQNNAQVMYSVSF